MNKGLSAELPDGISYFLLRDPNCFPRKVRDFITRHVKDALITGEHDSQGRYSKMCSDILLRLETSSTYASPKQLDVVLRFVKSLQDPQKSKVQEAVVKALSNSQWLDHVLELWHD